MHGLNIIIRGRARGGLVFCIATATVASTHAASFDASSIHSSAITTAADVNDGRAPVAFEASLARAAHKLDAAVAIAARFDDEARRQSIDPNWRYGMIANLMKADEANFPAVAYAPDLVRARLAAHDIAMMPQREFVAPTAKSAATPAATGSTGSGFGSPQQNLVYVPVSPCRIVDTRAGAILDAHTAHDYYFDAANVGSATCSVGASITSGAFPAALAINATVVAATFPGVSAYLAIYPQGSPKGSSFLNYTSAQTIANAGLVTINQSNGLFSVFNQESTNLIVDVFGVFTAPGGDTSASGTYATAFGLGTTASGGNSTALGYFTVAAGSDSTAMGHFSTALGAAPFSTAMGYAAQTGAPAAMSLGNHTQANGDSSVALGYYSIASAQRAVAMGDATVASGVDGATAMGSGTTASGSASTAMGATTIASNSFSTAMGASTQASGVASTAMGKQTTASGDYSTAMGYSNNANGYVSTTMGLSNTASGNMSTATGYNNSASGFAAFVGGQGNIASGTGSIALGIRAVAQSDYSFVFNGKTDTTFYATGPGSFDVSTPPGSSIEFHQAGQYCYMADVSSGWNCTSDRNLKTAIVPTDGRDVLAKLAAMPVSTWEWKADTRKGHKHLGPMAQDFMAAFHLGEDDKTISSTDAQGVALAAIKGLHGLLVERDAKVAALTEEVAALRAANAAQQRRLAQLETSVETLAPLIAQLRESNVRANVALVERNH